MSIAWITKGRSSVGLTLTFCMTQRSDETGQYSRIDRDSMAVSMPGVGPAGEAAVLKGFQARSRSE